MNWVELGFLGLFLATFIAATVVPFSSELVLGGMLVAGFDPLACVLVATTGNTLGGMTSYGLGRLGKWEAIHQYLRASESQVLSWKKHIDRFGAYFALLCWTPFVGDVIAIALGIFRVHWVGVLLGMTIGKLGRYVALAWFIPEMIS